MGTLQLLSQSLHPPPQYVQSCTLKFYFILYFMTSNFYLNTNIVLHTLHYMYLAALVVPYLVKEMIQDSILLLLPCKHSWLELALVTKQEQENQTVLEDIKRVWTPCIGNKPSRSYLIEQCTQREYIQYIQYTFMILLWLWLLLIVQTPLSSVGVL